MANLNYHSYQWLDNDELKDYNSIWVWCNKCQSKHGIGTDISSKHSNKCQLIPKKCNSEEDHCWKYIEDIYKDIFSISKNNTYLKINHNNLFDIEDNLVNDWKEWLIIGETSIHQCIVCKKENEEIFTLISKEQLKIRLDNNTIIQEKKEIEDLLKIFNNLKDENYN